MDKTIKFDRRKLLIGGMASLAVPSLVAGSETPAPLRAPFITQDRELVTLGSKDSGFQSQVEQLYPGLQENQQFQMMAPLAVLIQHKRGPAVRAYSLSWSVTTKSGAYQTTLYKYSQPGSKRRGRVGKSLASGQTDLLRAGEAHLATPFFTLTPDAYKASPTKWQSMIKPIEPGTYLTSQLQNATDTKVWMDAAVFGDHKVHGQDQNNLLRRFRSRRNAEHDTAQTIFDMVKAGKSDDDISSALQANVNVSRTNKKGPIGWYAQSKRNYSQFLMKKFHGLNREQFTRVVSNVATLNDTILHRPKP